MTQKALEDIRVLDLSSSLTGLLVTKYLADHGATVVWVESQAHLDVCRSSSPFKDGRAHPDHSGLATTALTSKYSFGLNMNRHEGKEVLKKLAKWSNVIVESHGPGVLKKWGFDYAQFSRLNSGVIMLSISIFGQTGPRAHVPGWGYYTQGFQGLPYFTGWPDRPGVSPPLAYTDVSTPWVVLSALLAALDYREQTGNGQHIDFSQLETGLHFIPGIYLLDYFANGRERGRNGNRHEIACPHGVYPCLGQDRWCAISIFTDQEWDTFCEIIGSPSWAKEEKFSSLRHRKMHEEELDAYIAQWSCSLHAEDIMHLLQGKGIACGVVQNVADLMDRDPQLKDRGYWRNLSRPGLENCRHPGWTVKLSETPYELMPTPRFCEHTKMVCKEFLHMNDEEIALLIAQGVLEMGC